MTDLLFVYGTLLRKGNPFANYLLQNSNYVFAGKIKGILYDIGEYPGLIITGNNHNYVYGSIYKLRQPEENLKIIDDYEGVGLDQEQPNLYTRQSAKIISETGAVDAWVYVYNRPVDGLPIIPSGNYMEYSKQKKSPGN
ncbi:gamma-glutamylcyclotransferase family protein [Mucilaginibacter phyllosphaerae]